MRMIMKSNDVKRLGRLQQHLCYNNALHRTPRRTSIKTLTLQNRFASSDTSKYTNIVKQQRQQQLSKKHKYMSTAAAYDHDLASKFTIPNANTNGDSNKTKRMPFLLADIGEGIAEVEILTWYVAPGERIAQFEKVCEVQSDKATVEITSRYDGIVEEISGSIGDMVEVGKPLMHIRVDDVEDNEQGKLHLQQHEELGSGGEESLQKGDVLAGSQITHLSDTSQPQATSRVNLRTGSREKVLATPAVRRLCKEYNLDLETITGTGPGGRVLKADALTVIEGGKSLPTPKMVGSFTNKEASLSENRSNDVSFWDNTNDKTVPIRGYNRLMVNAMTSTLQVPHMTYSDEVDMTSLIQCRNDLKQWAETNKGIQKLSFLPFVMKACSLAMKEYPILNSSIDSKEMNLTLHANHNIGVAMDSERGLVVPVVKRCQDLSIMEIAIELNRLRDLSEKGALPEDDLSGPTFSISNIGAIGGTIMSPVVLPPQVAIGAMGKIQRLPRFVGKSKEVQEAHLMNMSWGGDHRVIDGATLGRFSNLWKSYIESPMTMAFAMK